MMLKVLNKDIFIKNVIIWDIHKNNSDLVLACGTYIGIKHRLLKYTSFSPP